jgi:hypothetical protein
LKFRLMFARLTGATVVFRAVVGSGVGVVAIGATFGVCLPVEGPLAASNSFPCPSVGPGAA